MQIPTSTNMINANPILSIIIPTIGRIKELDELMFSLSLLEEIEQFEIIIVDQNRNGILDYVLDKYRNLSIRHLRVDFSGLSRAKNYGVEQAHGDWVCFPDDDCRIFQDTFVTAFQLIKENQCDLIFGKCIDSKGEDSVLKFKKEPYFLNKENMLGGFVEATVVCKKEIFAKFQFDENMGAGCFFGAEEGFDWLYRLLNESDYKAFYSPAIKFYHPQVILSKGDSSALNRVYKYRCGTAYLCVKHQLWKAYYKRLLSTKIASLLYLINDMDKATYYKTEYLALKVGKIFAEKTLSR